MSQFNLEDANKQMESIKATLLEEVSKSVAMPDPTKPLESHAMLKKKATLQAEEGLKSLNDTLASGMQALADALKMQGKEELTHEIGMWFQDNMHLSTMASADSQEQNQSLQDQLHFPPKYLNAIYEAGCFLADQNRNTDAIKVFAICLILNSELPAVWMQYGLALQKNQQHEEAIYAFSICSILSAQENPYTYAHIARSLITFKLWQEAEENLELALKYATENEELTGYCHHLHEWIQNNKNK
jgi:tetratricopeptide (TPR) repeat protein